MSPDHKLRSRKPKPSVESHSGDSSQAHSASALRLSTLLLVTTAALDMASMSVSTMPVRAMSQPLFSPSPSPSSVAVIRGSLDDSHGLMAQLRYCSFNCRGLNNGLHTLSHFIDFLIFVSYRSIDFFVINFI